MASSFESFSDGETFATVIGVGFGLFPFLRWNTAIWNDGLFGATLKSRRPLLSLPFVGALALEWTLAKYADRAVQNDWRYQGFFLLYGAIWLNVALMVGSLFRLSLKQDVIERNNPAAVTGITGVLTSFLIVYGGGNIGSGTTVGTTFASVILGTLALVLCWFLIEVISGPTISITEDRDVSSAYRLSGALMAIALIVARAIAGDWISLSATVDDLYLKAWPSLIFVALAIALQFRMRPTPQNPRPDVLRYGIVPAAAEGAAALVFLIARAAYG